MVLRRLVVLGLLTLSLAAAAPARAAPNPGPIAVKVIETTVLPHYRAFAQKTDAQAKAWRDACADGDGAAEREALREAYQSAADSWAAVDYVTTGPVGESLRMDRIYFSPDKRNYVPKAIVDLAAKAKAGELTPEIMRGASVAGQGFPALERALYDPGDVEPAALCKIAVAITQNIATIAVDILTEWTADSGTLAHLKRGEGDKLHFADPAQGAARLMTDLAGGLQRMNDLRIMPVLGNSADAAKPKSADAWRSGRSARALGVTAASLVETAKAFQGFAPADVAKTNAKAFDVMQAAVAKLPADLGDAAADPKRRKPVEAAVAAIKAAQTDLVKNLAPALGLPLGFNALDGD